VAERQTPQRTEVRPGRQPRTGKPGPDRTKRAPAGADGRSVDDRHRTELLGLACLGLALFLAFILVWDLQGGFLGRGARGLLSVVAGRLAFLVPVGLVALAAALIFERRPRWRSVWLPGGLLVLLSLFLLVAAGFPPLGPGHGTARFVGEVYRGRAGWLGEALFAGLYSLIGLVGVALLGWLGLLAGVSLITGLTLRRVSGGAGRAAAGARRTAEQTRRRLRDGDPEGRPGPLDDPYLTGFGPPAAEPGSPTGHAFGAHQDEA